MREQAVKNDERSFLHFERDESVHRPPALVQYFKTGAAAWLADETRFKSEPMPAGDGPEAAVLRGRVFEREPEARHAQGPRVEERGVLMTGHFAADAGLLEDVH